MPQKINESNTALDVCSKSNLFCNGDEQRRELTRLRVARHRARKLLEASGEAILCTECRECGAKIEPSYLRHFCPRSTGRNCRKAFFKKIQVPHFVDVTLADVSLSEAVLAAEVLRG